MDAKKEMAGRSKGGHDNTPARAKKKMQTGRAEKERVVSRGRIEKCL